MNMTINFTTLEAPNHRCPDDILDTFRPRVIILARVLLPATVERTDPGADRFKGDQGPMAPIERSARVWMQAAQPTNRESNRRFSAPPDRGNPIGIPRHNRGAGAVLLACLMLAVALVLWPGSTRAVEWRGRLTSDLYVLDSDSGGHQRPYLGVQSSLVLWRGALVRSLSAQVDARWTTDFSHKRATDPQLYIYDGYLHLTGVPRGTDIALGRQFVYTALGSALVDGVQSSYRPVRQLELRAFAGSSVSGQAPETMRSLAGFGVFGGRIGIMAASSVRLGVTWMLSRSDGRVSSHRLGLDGRKEFRQTDVFSRLAYDVSLQRIAGAMARVGHRPGRWNLSGEYEWRRPSIAGNGLFSLLDAKGYQNLRLNLERRVGGGLAVVSGVHLASFEGANVWRTLLGLRSGDWSIVWQHQDGSDGDNDALRGSLTARLGRHWESYVTANLSRYRIQAEQKDRNDSYASMAGVQWRGAGGFGFRVEGQYLRNAVQRHDYRMRLQVSKDFALLPQAGENAP